MGVSVGGHSDPHLHSACPRCGYATRYKQWPTNCACTEVQRQIAFAEIWGDQELRNAELHEIVYSHAPPLRIADRYSAGRLSGVQESDSSDGVLS
jgi:hypothetical protein